MMETTYSCCKVTLAIYYKWIANIRESQYHQGPKHTNLMVALKQVLGDFSMPDQIPARKTSNSSSQCTGHKESINSKDFPTTDDSHTYHIACTLFKCKYHEQIDLIKVSSKDRDIVGLPAAGLNSPTIPVKTKDVARVLRCLRRHLLPATSRRPGC